MTKKPVPRSLPLLGEVYQETLPFPERENHLALLTDALRSIASELQKKERLTFYSQQSVAQFFRVPLRTVALAYGQLQREGLLICRRGSSTQLTGRVRRSGRPVRGVVGLPIWRHGFTLLPCWQRLIAAIEEELRALDFVADLVFFGQDHDMQHTLQRRLMDHHLDHLIWLYPWTSSQQIIARLEDQGVSCLTIFSEKPSLVPGGIRLCYEQAWRDALVAWRSDGIREIVAIGPDIPPMLNPLCSEFGIGLHSVWRIAESERPRLPSDAGLVFPHDIALAFISQQHPDLITDLVRHRRVLVLDALPLHYIPPDLRVDILAQDWQAIARASAELIANGSFNRSTESQIAHACYLPNANPREARFGYTPSRTLLQEQAGPDNLAPLLQTLKEQ